MKPFVLVKLPLRLAWRKRAQSFIPTRQETLNFLNTLKVRWIFRVFFMATMKDIARLAQVSTSTVSHVINGSRFVSDEIREKVMRIVAELNYTPSAVARSLKVRETKTIGLLVTATNNPSLRKWWLAEQYCQKINIILLLLQRVEMPNAYNKICKPNAQTVMVCFLMWW